MSRLCLAPTMGVLVQVLCSRSVCVSIAPKEMGTTHMSSLVDAAVFSETKGLAKEARTLLA